MVYWAWGRILLRVKWTRMLDILENHDLVD